MAPKKAGTSRELSKREKDWAEWRPVRAFYPPGMNLEATENVACMAATDFNEGGATVCHPSNLTALQAGDARLFRCFIAAGLVPPASLFFLAVVASFGLHVSHLHPNAMVTLAIFQHLCEGFVGIHASVALFRHYFKPRVEEECLAGAVTWHRRSQQSSPFISLELRNKWDEWRHQWCFVRFPEADDAFGAPAAVPDADESWDCLDDRDRELAPAFERIEALHKRGLTGLHVALDFLRCTVAPL